jgi:hypothetical protein
MSDMDSLLKALDSLGESYDEQKGIVRVNFGYVLGKVSIQFNHDKSTFKISSFNLLYLLSPVLFTYMAISGFLYGDYPYPEVMGTAAVLMFFRELMVEIRSQGLQTRLLFLAL